MTTIVLARHGETDWNREKRWQGFADPSLNEGGRQQAAALAKALEGVPFSAVYASDLRRAYETALVVAEWRGLAVTPMRELREIDVGSWTGLTQDEVRDRLPDAYREMKTRSGRGWEGGETYAEMGVRVLDAIRRIGRRHPAEVVLVVMHSGPMRSLQAHARGLDYATDRTAAPPVDRVAFSAVRVDDGLIRPADAEVERFLGANARRRAT